MRTVFKKRWFGPAILLFGALSLFEGCANMNTIGRTTSLDSTNDKGKAIHLDIQQRLLVVNAMKKYCAEPSPDAMAAFAAAAGIGANAPTQDAVSAAGSMSSSAASIGLRTQSITLMRDALYRMCEAYGNEMLSKPQVMTLLSRSQDLTAVILATEQLTGAVVAHQAALSGIASADATAVITATSQLLEAALKQQERAQAWLERAMERKAAAEDRQWQAQEEHAAAQADTRPGAAARLKKAGRDLEAANHQVGLAEEIRALREKTLASATENVESLQSAQDSAFTSAAAAFSSSAALSGGGERSRLSDQSSQTVAAAVSSMVNNVLNKSYVLDYCMAMISSNDNEDVINIEKADHELCRKIVDESMGVEELRVTGTFGSDINIINCIKAWLNLDETNKATLDQWRKENAGDLDHGFFMFGENAASLRSAAIKDLSIPCN